MLCGTRFSRILERRGLVLTERDRPNRKFILNLLAFLALLIFLATSFRAGWTRSETDFPNYYTAAWLVRRGAPLRNYYDWTWFQRQMNYAGVERQLGGYIPQTPLTMLPILPLAALSPQHAKQVWLVLGVLFLLASVGILGRVPGICLVGKLFVAVCA